MASKLRSNDLSQYLSGKRVYVVAANADKGNLIENLTSAGATIAGSHDFERRDHLTRNSAQSALLNIKGIEPPNAVVIVSPGVATKGAVEGSGMDVLEPLLSELRDRRINVLVADNVGGIGAIGIKRGIRRLGATYLSAIDSEDIIRAVVEMLDQSPKRNP